MGADLDRGAPVAPALPAKGNILGVGVSATDYAEITDLVADAARRGRALLVTACSVHGIIEAQDDALFSAVLNRFDIVAPDGQPVRWGLDWTGQAHLPQRVYGPTLTLEVARRAACEGLPLFLYGSRPEVLDALTERLQQRFEGLSVAGRRAGRFRPLTAAEQKADAEEILASGARIVLVGMGCPRQDWWIFHMRERIPRPMLAVGAAFDFHAGLLSQAPPVLQRAGLEWAYRLGREPRRLWRRYLLTTPRYLPLIAAQSLGLKRFEAAADLAEADARPCPG